MTFDEAVKQAEAAGLISKAVEIAPNVWLTGERADKQKRYQRCGAREGWRTVARELAEYLPGQVRPVSSGGVSWINGGGGPHGILVDAQNFARVMEARDAVRSLCGLPDKPCWSLGTVARHLMRWVSPEGQKYRPDAEYLLDGVEYGFHMCVPGVYEDLTQYDVRGYYYDMIKRLPSLFLRVGNGRLLWQDMDPDTRERWKDAIDAIDGCKGLRNTLAGCFAGSFKRHVAYTWDKQRGRVKAISVPGGAGNFRAAGLLLVRSGWELCRAESLQSGSVYSTIDCVTCASSCAPSVWPSWGFHVSPIATGQAEICYRGCYRVGHKVTRWYAQGRRARVERLPGEPPQIQYHRQWLNAV